MFAADIGFTALIDDPTDVNVAKMAVSIALIGEKISGKVRTAALSNTIPVRDLAVWLADSRDGTGLNSGSSLRISGVSFL